MKKLTTLPDQLTNSEDYKNLVDLMALLGEAQDNKAEIQTELNRENRSLLDEQRKKLVELETAITQAEQGIELICKRHPEWFVKAKTLKVSYGSCSFRNVSEIVAKSEDHSIAKIKAAGRAKDFIRTQEELDLEALEKLSDLELAAFGLERKVKESFNAKPAKVDIGKAVAEQAAEAKAA